MDIEELGMLRLIALLFFFSARKRWLAPIRAVPRQVLQREPARRRLCRLRRQERDSGFPVTRMTNALSADANTASLTRTWWTDGVTWAGLVPAYVIKRMASAIALPLLICACQSSSAPNPSAHTSAGVTPSSVDGSWQTPSAREVTLGAVGDLAVSPQAVYALYTPAGTQGNLAGAINTMLARIDRASGIVHKAGPFPGALRIAVGAGSVWVGGSSQYPASPYPGAIGVVRLDPDSLKQLVSVALPGEGDQRALVAAVAASADHVWLAYGRHLYQLDPTTGAVQSKQSLDGIAASIAIDSKTSRLYVGSDAAANQTQATITEWDTATMRKLASDVTGGAGLGGPQVAAAGNDAWGGIRDRDAWSGRAPASFRSECAADGVKPIHKFRPRVRRGRLRLDHRWYG